MMGRFSRRRFMQDGLASIVVLSASRAWALPASTPIGLQLYSVGADLKKDTAGTLKRVHEIGYTRVETAGLGGQSAKDFRKMLDDNQLQCHSAHLQLNSGELGALFEEARVTGAHYVVSSLSFPQGHGQTADDYKEFAGRVNEMGRKAKQAGLQYAYHNHNPEFRPLDGGKTGYEILLQETDPQLVQLELDCGWAVAAGANPTDLFKRYPGRYKMLHIKDFAGSKSSTSLSKEERPQGTELGRGRIDYKPILAAAAKAGIFDYYVEQEPPFLEMPPFDAITVDYKYLRAL